MAARRDMTDSQKDLAAIVEEAAEVGASRGYEQQRMVTPTPVRISRTGDSAEMYEVAERVVMRNRPAEWVACEEKGPAARLGRRMDSMDQRMDRAQNNYADDRKADAAEMVRVNRAIDKFIGERNFKQWILPIVTNVLCSSLAAALVMRLLRAHP